eukprot:UN05183
MCSGYLKYALGSGESSTRQIIIIGNIEKLLWH